MDDLGDLGVPPIFGNLQFLGFKLQAWPASFRPAMEGFSCDGICEGLC